MAKPFSFRIRKMLKLHGTIISNLTFSDGFIPFSKSITLNNSEPFRFKFLRSTTKSINP